MHSLWQPIGELTDRYAANLLLCAPELLDLDCNEHAVGMGYWQDGMGWLACKWDMSNDLWKEVCCNPTHFMFIQGP